jgi:hypothetical protein
MERVTEDVIEQASSRTRPPESPDYAQGLGECLSTATPPSPRPDANDEVVIAEPSTDPYAPTFLPEVLRLQPSELPTDLRDRIYNFCRANTVANLRKMAKSVAAPTQGSKAALSATVFAVAWKRVAAVSEQSRAAEWHRCCPCGDGSSYRDWLESPKVQTMTWWRAPSDELLTQYNPTHVKAVPMVCRDGIASSDDRPLSVSEFARLSCILTQDEEAKRALLDSQLDLTRAQLDRSERRDDFWTKTIAPLFNSPDTIVSFIPPTELSGVSANVAPLTLRSGARLMRSWAGTRSLFTVCHVNWSASGQNDPTNFSSFLPAAPGGGDHIPADARRALILFHVLGCGTEHENTTVLDCVRRTSKAPYDDLEESPNGTKLNAQGRSEGSVGGNGRKRKLEEDVCGSGAFLEGAKRLAEAISAPQSDPSSSATNELGSATILETSRLIEEYSRLLSLLRDARLAESADNDYVEILQTQVRLAKDRIKMSQKREEERNSSGRW